MGFEKSFKALSDPVRREILQLLRNGAMTAGHIAEHFDMTKATISYHLRLLKEAGLICEAKEKNFIYYDLNTTLVEEMMGWLMSLKERKND
ncbi:autorepressor SdpR family transcription factor [Weissella hellenica]|nr:autorepressor SdpR family transcription factor [Weissella hellenica]NKY66251.1 winged helix-turn-helix transcriptional regulator [Weissella hellenica]GED35710.1 transcriptional regulator [Weissella hellenica]